MLKPAKIFLSQFGGAIVNKLYTTFPISLPSHSVGNPSFLPILGKVMVTYFCLSSLKMLKPAKIFLSQFGGAIVNKL